MDSVLCYNGPGVGHRVGSFMCAEPWSPQIHHALSRKPHQHHALLYVLIFSHSILMSRILFYFLLLFITILYIISRIKSKDYLHFNCSCQTSAMTFFSGLQCSYFYGSSKSLGLWNELFPPMKSGDSQRPVIWSVTLGILMFQTVNCMRATLSLMTSMILALLPQGLDIPRRSKENYFPN